MVYGGKPSTGCYLCRKRKIKCDEAHPECRNCKIYGRPCPGYRPDAVFRNETQKVERLVKNSGSASSASGSAQSTPTSATSAASTIAVVAPQRKSTQFHTNDPLNLYSPTDSTWEERALCYFFDQYTIQADEDGGHLDYIPPLYAREIGQTSDSTPSCLKWAVDATALMTLANAKNAPVLMNKARQGYGKALRGLQEALNSPIHAVKDETFASVVLLSLYEDISGERNGLFSSHTAGFEFLMKLRGAGQMGHQRGRDMFNFAYTHTYVEILALGDNPRFDLDWVSGMLNSDCPVEQLMLSASKLTRLFLLMRSTPQPPDQATVESWITAGRECDAELSQWTQTLPDRWLPLVVYSAHGESLLTYNRISNAIIWYYYRAVRVMLQQLLLGLNRTLTTIKTANKQWSSSGTSGSGMDFEPLDEANLLAVICEMTTDTCRSIPFSLADVDSLGRPNQAHSPLQIRAAQGYGLLWPLWYVLSCGMPTEAQVQQIRTALWRVGSKLGIKLALILAREAETIRGTQTDITAGMNQRF
ncbi:unnamed protein product [Penicillium salamii]|uniref:Zn(2)-C6 fungal-type domain-containing protein n=1 Tax=Penicillium salamii TaxID=1612424 RepID=A0A9W4JK05_9EURO|nr:unnamed protein product [Penicillium salamii]CAG8368410.1 unnamed protein product [Penicillium salamii]CAG8397809.1 unnamed protein product [Penicillium salamii]CAG8404643.1 unnamed protein product [Penicillium salamii]